MHETGGQTLAQAYMGPRKGFACTIGPAMKTNRHKPSWNSLTKMRPTAIAERQPCTQATLRSDAPGLNSFVIH
jgi:hypothetical protein